MGQAQKVKDAERKRKEQEEIVKASEATAQQCLNEINAVLKKYNCTIEVQHKEDTVMGERILRFGSVVIHHLKKEC